MIEEKRITNDYIRGLVDGGGSFSFSSRKSGYDEYGNITKQKVPSFALSMREQDKELLEKVRNHLGLRNKIYIFESYRKDGYKRERKAVLVVREFGQLKDIIIPFFYHGLIGYKQQQFFEWLEKIGNDPSVPETFKFLHWLHKRGWYKKNLRHFD